MNFMRSSYAVLNKDLKLEMRTKFGVNTVFAFVLSSLLILIFALRAEDLPDQARSGLFWIIVMFAALASLSRSFVSESDQGTLDLLRLHFPATHVYTGKLLYNFLFTLTVATLSLLVYIFILNISVTLWVLLAITILFGSLGMASVSTILASLVAQSSQKGAIFSVLSIPLLIPLILILAKTTFTGFYGDNDGLYINDMMALVGYCGVTITAGSLLFDFVWDDE
jgi:heme exporter protein B